MSGYSIPFGGRSWLGQAGCWPAGSSQCLAGVWLQPINAAELVCATDSQLDAVSADLTSRLIWGPPRWCSVELQFLAEAGIRGANMAALDD